MPAVKLEELRQVAINKRFLRIVRVNQLQSVARQLKKNEALHDFHKHSLQLLLQMHPHASKRMVSQLGNSFQLEGSMRTARNKDAINVGLIKEQESVINKEPDPHASTAVSNRASPMIENNHEDSFSRANKKLHKIGNIFLEVQQSAQALSPSGRKLPKEMESR